MIGEELQARATARARTTARRVLPPPVKDRLRWLRTKRYRGQIAKAARALAATGTEPQHLDPGLIAVFQERYPGVDDVRYDEASLSERGAQRARVLSQLPGFSETTSILEVACWDGMVSASLTGPGRSVVAIDYRSDGFDARAREAGVELRQMDAASMDFEDESFDAVFSYDAFEHFGSPRDVLQEMERVLRPGGLLFLEFGPLYLSPFGEHAYPGIRVPYCSVLFGEDDLNEFCRQNSLREIDFSHVNRWRVHQYRHLWREHTRLERLSYSERREVLRHLDLIQRHPSCFANLSRDIDDFTVSTIEVLFRKRA